MTKRILVVLDSDADTPVAIDTAITIAKRHRATVTGLALVSTEEIDKDTAGGGIGSMYYAEKMREELKTEVRTKAQELLQEFRARIDAAGVSHTDDHVGEGEAVEVITQDMLTHDLLVSGNRSHFYYADPDRRTHSIAQVVEEGAAPVLIVTPTFSDVERVLVAYDGSAPGARAMHEFAHLVPFGRDLEMEVVHVASDKDRSENILRRARAYLIAQGFENVLTTTLSGSNASETLLSHAASQDTDLIVTGAYAKSGIKRFFFGTTATRLIDQDDISVFLTR